MTRMAIFALAWAATPAHAHGTLPGGGGFYAGAAHPFVSIDHLLLLVALGLVLSQHDLRAGLGVLVLGVILGLALPFWDLRLDASGPLIFVFAIIAGASLALAWNLPPPVTLTLCAASGVCIGLQTDVPLGTLTMAATAGAGVALAVFLIAAYAFAMGTLTRHRLQGIHLRVAGSWIVAIAVMMLAFLLRGVMGVAA